MEYEHNRICVVCGKPFYAKQWAQVTCSKQCSEEYRKEKAKQYRDNHRSTDREPVVFNRICKVCGKPFTTVKNGQMVCSDQCRAKSRNEAQKRYYVKKKEHPEEYEPKAKQTKETDVRYDWLRKFDPIIKEMKQTGLSYGKITSRRRR